MTQIMLFKCDGCGVKFTPRDEKDPRKAALVGGATGFTNKMVKSKEGGTEYRAMQYSFDFCVKCNKKVIELISKEFKDSKDINPPVL